MERARSLSEVFPAVVRSATTSQSSIVVRIAVITGEFVPGIDVLFGIKLHSAVRDADKQVGIARVVDKLKESAADAAVNGGTGTDLHDHDSFGPLGAFPGFAGRDTLTGEFSQLPPGADGSVGE